MLGFYQSYACHNSEINYVTSVDNGDGTTTFTINVTIDVGSSDGYNYGFLLDFYSSNNPVVIQSISPASFTKSGEDIVGYYGNNVGSGDYTNSGVNGFGIYAAENVVAYEYVGRYWYTSSDYTSEVVVTVSGCVEEIMFQADFRSATLDPYSLADQCADFYTVGVCQNDPCPANNASIESCSGFFDLNSLETIITGSTDYDLSWSVANPDNHSGSDGDQVTVTVSGANCLDADATITLEGGAAPTVFNGVYEECGVLEATYDLQSVEVDIAPFDYNNATFTWYADMAKQNQITNLNNYVSSPTTLYVEVNVGGCISDATLELQLQELDVEKNVSINECDAGSIANFDLLSLNDIITKGNDEYEVDWFSDNNLNFAITSAGSYNSSATTVYASVSSTESDCETIIPVELSVGEVTANDHVIDICSSGGDVTINLVEEEFNINSASGYSITWYEESNLSGRINFPSAYITEGGTIYAQVVEDAGTCSGIAEVSINIENGPTVFNGVYEGCDDGTGVSTFDLSSTEADIAPFDVTTATFTWFEDAQYNNEVFNRFAYPSGNATLYVLVSNGSCSSEATLELQVADFSISDQTLSACDDGSGEASFNLDELAEKEFPEEATITWYEESNHSTVISSPSSFTSGAVTVYAEVVSGACSTNVAVSLTLGGVIANNQSMSVCDRGNGEGVFNLTSIASDVNGNTANEVTWWTDAGASSDQIDDPSNYEGASGIVYARVSAGDDCYEVASITLSLEGDIDINNLSFDLENIGNNQGSIDLSAIEDDITDASNLITFYLDEALTTEINPDNIFTTISITIYALVSNTDGCSGVATITITVEEEIIIVGPELVSVEIGSCLGNNGMAIFDLTSKEDDVLNGNTGSLEWFTNLDFANEITNPTAYESGLDTVYAKLVGSDSWAEVVLVFADFRTSEASMQMCDNGFGAAVFNLNLLNDEITNGGGYSITWFEDEAMLNQITNPQGYSSEAKIIYASVNIGNCTEIVAVTLSIGDLEVANTSMSLCEDASGNASFDLTSINEEISGSSIYTVNWYYDKYGNVPVTNPSQLTSSGGDTVYTQVVANSLCQSDIAPVALNVETIRGNPTSIVNCFGGTYTQFFDLTTANKTVNNGTNNQVVWYTDITLEEEIINPNYYVPSDDVNGIALIYAEVCDDVVDVSLVVRLDDTLAVNIDFDETTVENSETLELGTDVEEVSYLWEPSEGLDDSSSSNPIFSGDTSITYHLTVTDEFGCEAYDSVFIRVVDQKKEIVVSSEVFSPDGNGENDKLFFTVEGTCQMDVKVFNRWGVVLFETNSTEQGWDGTYNNQLVPSGTYVYVMTAQFCGSDEAYQYNGEIYLVR